MSGMAAGVDTLDGFIREMKIRFPDATARATLPPEARGEPAKSGPAHTGSLPAIVGVKRAGASRRALSRGFGRRNNLAQNGCYHPEAWSAGPRGAQDELVLAAVA
jgi:hypothetical protein